MAGPIVFSEKTIESMRAEASKRLGITVINLKEALDSHKITPEELMVNGIVASMKEVLDGKTRPSPN